MNNKECMRKIFEIMEQIDDLGSMGENIHIPAKAHAVTDQQPEPEPQKSAVSMCRYLNVDKGERKRYSPVEKEMIARQHIEDGYTLRELAANYGVSEASVKRWCAEVKSPNWKTVSKEEITFAPDVPEASKEEAMNPGANHDTRKRYPPEVKKLIVRLHTEDGYTFERITREYGVSKATVTKWCSDARFVNKINLRKKEQEMQKIIEENKKIREENMFLKRIVVLLFGQGMEVQNT